MRFHSAFLCASIAFMGGSVQAEVDTAPAPMSATCAGLNKDALARVAQGQSSEAENMLSAALADSDHLNHVCAGVIMNNIAALLLTSGRLTEAGVMAMRYVIVYQIGR